MTAKDCYECLNIGMKYPQPVVSQGLCAAHLSWGADDDDEPYGVNDGYAHEDDTPEVNNDRDEAEAAFYDEFGEDE